MKKTKNENLEFKKEISKQILSEVIGLDEFQLERLIENREMVIRELNKLENLTMEYFENEFKKLNYIIIKKTEEYLTINNKKNIGIKYGEYDEILIRADEVYFPSLYYDNELLDLIRKFQKWYWSEKNDIRMDNKAVKKGW